MVVGPHPHSLSLADKPLARAAGARSLTQRACESSSRAFEVAERPLEAAHLLLATVLGFMGGDLDRRAHADANGCERPGHLAPIPAA